MEIAPRDLAELETAVCAAPCDVVVHLDAKLPPVTLAAMRAAIGPLAVASAPAGRVNALVHDSGADAGDIAAATRWLNGAASTTGQVLEISLRAPAA